MNSIIKTEKQNNDIIYKPKRPSYVEVVNVVTVQESELRPLTLIKLPVVLKLL